MQWNSDWEYENQETLKDWYALKVSGKCPDLLVRRIICKGCGRVFYTQVPVKKYCRYDLCGNRGYPKDMKMRRERDRSNMVCKCCGKVFTPKRAGAVYCSNACRQKAYRQRTADRADGLGAERIK